MYMAGTDSVAHKRLVCRAIASAPSHTEQKLLNPCMPRLAGEATSLMLAASIIHNRRCSNTGAATSQHLRLDGRS